MSRKNSTKLNKLITSWPHGAVYLTTWLKRHSYTLSLVDEYRRAGWLESIGGGAVIRAGDSVDWRGGLFGLRHQLELPVHLGGKAALDESGAGHFVGFNRTTITLFTPTALRLPRWFLNWDWGVKIEHIRTDLFRTDLGVQERKTATFSFPMSTTERAAFEMLYLVPRRQTIEEAKLIMQGLTTLRPQLVQKLLEECRSIKVRRLFMLLAEGLQLPWVKKLNLSNVDFGKGPRSLIKGGKRHPKYLLTIPPDLFQGEP